MAVKKGKASEETAAEVVENTHQKTSEMAYKIYLERQKKNVPGDAASDWAAAEAKLNGKKK